MSEKQPKFGRAFTAAINADWMLWEPKLKEYIALAARMNPEQMIFTPEEFSKRQTQKEKAVEAYGAEYLDGSWNTRIRDGVAIIYVTGPIFRYANFFTYWCGGTTIDDLALDLQLCLDSSNIYSLLFEINSPGGEVTGVNEFCEMVFNARGIKPITARVGGYGCSAAYWIASACGTIYADDTAQLGSIGVCTTYLDDTKNLKMNGFEEIDIISSQSPYKNTPPTVPEGKARIQARIDALAQVFVEKVARNRSVSVETVLADFGKGDCFIGQTAVDQGLADSLGSFEEVWALMAETHSPHLYRGRTAAAGQKTLISANELTSSESEEIKPEALQESDEIQPINGEEMSEKDKENLAAESSSKAEEEEIAPAANSNSSEKEAPAESASEIETLRAENLRLTNEKADADIRAKSAEKLAAETAMKTEIKETVKDFAGSVDAKAEFLFDLTEKFGKDSAQVKAYVADQTALAEQIRTGDLFHEKGAGNQGESGNTDGEKLQAIADRMFADGRLDEKGKKVTKQKAYMIACEENRELYKAMRSGK